MIYFPFSPLMPCENLNFSKIYVSTSIHSAINVPLPTTGLIINTELMSSCLAFSPPTPEASFPKSKSCSQERQLFQPGCSSGRADGLFSAILQMCIPSSTTYREEKIKITKCLKEDSFKNSLTLSKNEFPLNSTKRLLQFSWESHTLEMFVPWAWYLLSAILRNLHFKSLAVIHIKAFS